MNEDTSAMHGPDQSRRGFVRAVAGAAVLPLFGAGAQASVPDARTSSGGTVNAGSSTAPALKGGFPISEFERRLARVQQLMASAGLDALVIANPANLTYLVGAPMLETQYLPQAVILTPTHRVPTLIMRPQDAVGAALMSWLPRESILAYPEDYVGHPTLTGYDWIRERLHDLTSERAVVGVEEDSLSSAALRTLQQDAGKRQWRDTSILINSERRTKSPAEIAIMRQAAAISDNAMRVAVQAIRPGRVEAHAAADIIAALFRGTDEYPGDVAFAPIMPSGPRTGAAHANFIDGRYKLGEHVNVELGGYRYRYAAGLSRSVQIGPLTPEFRSVHSIAVEGLEACIAAAKPGATCESVWQAFNRVAAPRGLAKPSRCGYPMGIEWMDGTVVGSLKPGEMLALDVNMVYHIMLGMWVRQDWGFVISETVLIEPKGAISLSKFGREPLCTA